MRRRRRIVVCGAGAALVLQTALMHVGVAAASGDPTPVFGLRPALRGTTTMTSGHFSYALQAGAHLRDAVIVDNFTAGPLTLNMYRANALTTPQGGFAPGQQAQPPLGATPWIALSRATLILPPHSEQRVPFTVAIPRGTPPGDYLATIVGAPVSTQRVANGLTLVSRAALVVDVTVVGHAHPALSLGVPQVSGQGPNRLVTIDVANTGNVLISLSGTIDVSNGSDQLALPLGPANAYVLPGGQASLTTIWSRVPPIGWPTLNATVTAAVSGTTVAVYTTHPVRLLLIPWKYVQAAVVILVVVGATWLLTRKRRAQRRSRRTEDARILAEYRSLHSAPASSPERHASAPDATTERARSHHSPRDRRSVSRQRSDVPGALSPRHRRDPSRRESRIQGQTSED